MNRSVRLTGLGITVVATAIFVFSFFNRYLGASLDGWFQWFGLLALNGRLPYRDYFFWATPLHIFEHALVLKLFGTNLFGGKLVGALLRVALAGVLYAWTVRFVRPAIAVFAATAAMFVGCDDNSEPVFYYTQQALFYGVIAGYLTTRALSGEARLLPFAGAVATLGLLAKHTIGGAALLALAGLVVAHDRLAPKDRPRALRPFILGAAIPLALFLLYLVVTGSLGPFVRQVLIEAPAAKGSPAGTMLRIVTVLFRLSFFRHAGLTGIALLAAMIALKRYLGAVLKHWTEVALLLVGPGIVLLVATLWGAPLGGHAWSPRFLQLVAASFGTWGAFYFTVVDLVHCVRRRDDADRFGWLIFGATSAALSYALSLSWGLYEQMAFPSLAFVLARVADDEEGPYASLSSWLVPTLSTVTIASAVYCKHAEPFNWSQWKEPPLEAPRGSVPVDALAAMNVSRETAGVLARIAETVNDRAAPHDTVFTFPDLPLVNFMTERDTPTFAQLHWFDVTPDDVVRADIQRLEQNPPKIMVLTAYPEGFFEIHEQLFRDGRPSAQREFLLLFDRLAPRYDLTGRIPVPGHGAELLILVRRDEPPAP